MADRSRFGPELTEAETNALVDNTIPGNIMIFFFKTIILLELAGYKMIITVSALRTSLVIYITSSVPSAPS